MSKELVVAKFGSNILVSDEFDTNEQLSTYAEILISQHDPEDLLVVSSGAVAIGKRVIAEMGKNPDVFTLQQKAQLGGTAMAEAWRSAFKAQGVLAGGLFVTHHELDNKQEGGSLRKLLNENRQMGVVSIMNENDALSEIELMKLLTGGDNDGLARHIGEMVGADELHLYTKSGGVMDSDGKFINTVTAANELAVTAMLESRAVSKDAPGRGGILSKHQQAILFSATGKAVIAPPPTDKADQHKVTIYPRAA